MKTKDEFINIALVSTEISEIYKISILANNQIPIIIITRPKSWVLEKSNCDLKVNVSQEVSVVSKSLYKLMKDGAMKV